MLMIALTSVGMSCSKDAPIEEHVLDDSVLAYETQSTTEEKTVYSVFAYAGDHPGFKRTTDGFPVHVFAVVPDGATDLAYFETDSLTGREQLHTYRRKSIEAQRLGDGLLVRLTRGALRTDRFCRLSYRIGDSLYVSPAVTIRSHSLTTGDVASLTTYWSSQGYYTFDWRSVAGAASYLLILRDQRGDALMAVSTQRSNFPFYDLRSVEQTFFPSLRSPSLVEGANYELEVIALTDRHWMIARGVHSFTFASE